MCAMALRGTAHEIILVNRNHERARGAVADLQYGAVLGPHVSLRAGGLRRPAGTTRYDDHCGRQRKEGGATDRNDPAGRLKLLANNATVYKDIVPRIVAAAPDALLLVITDPPDPLADVTRRVGRA